MSKEIYVIEKRKDRSGLGIILIAALLIAFWKVIIFVAIMAGTAYLITRLQKAVAASRDKRISKNAATALRADHENQLFLREGVYEGEYPCVTMPMTAGPDYLMAEHLFGTKAYGLYGDYDDGLRDWK